MKYSGITYFGGKGRNMTTTCAQTLCLAERYGRH